MTYIEKLTFSSSNQFVLMKFPIYFYFMCSLNMTYVHILARIIGILRSRNSETVTTQSSVLGD